MNILYVGYPSGKGKAPHQEMAALHLARLGHAVDHVCWGGSPSDRSVELENLRYMPQPKQGVLSALRLMAVLFRRVTGRSPAYDVIYVQGAQQTPFLFWLPLVRGRRRIIYHTQDFLEPRRHRFYERFERRFARHADYVLSNEANRARFMKSYYGLPRIPVVVPTALPEWWPVPERSDAYRCALLERSGVSRPDEAVIIISGGPYRPDRMSPQLLEAFAHLPDNYVLVFNGPAMAEGEGCRRMCEEAMERLGVARRVVFLGGLDFNELLALYAAGDLGILLYPNDGVGHYYQCPGRFSEYLRAGLSLVTSNFPGLELLVLKHGLGAVADSENPESIAAALLEAGSRARERRGVILQTVHARFIYERNEEVLESVVKGTYAFVEPSVST